MRRINPWAIVLLSCSLLSGIQAQEVFRCGTTAVEEVKRQMLQNRQEMSGFLFDRNSITYIPVRFHLVARSDGSGRPSSFIPLKALCFLNANYADQQIQFFLRDVRQLDNTTVYNNPGSSSGASIIGSHMIYDAINVFIVGEMLDETAAYYQPPAGKNGADWIVISNTFAEDPRVLTHEIGHFFSLPHPFHGWETSGGWNPDFHGNPVGAFAPNGKTLNEFVNGSNCQTAGDGICDTPADYLFPSLDCKYNANAKDPLNELLKPDVQNFMNYHFSCKTYAFTPQQKSAIANSLFHSTRDYLKHNIAAKTGNIFGTPMLISPSSNTLVPTFNKVELKWEAVTGADNYFIEVSNAQHGTQRFISSTNSLILSTLTSNSGYWWRVMGYNEFSTCGSFSNLRLFRTGDVLNSTNEAVKNWKWKVYPNVVSTFSSIKLEMNTAESFTANIKLVSMTGQTITLVQNHRFFEGNSVVELNPGPLSPGVYVINIVSESGVDGRRIAVLEN